MYANAKSVFASTLAEIEQAGLWKHERLITSPQAAHITTAGKEVINFCANNYLGLSSHPRILAAARKALDERGYGLSSVRFICGTQDRHKDLEAAVSKFLQTEDTILYSSCFDANGGLFETVLSEQDAIISDALNHASIIDGIRLCKADRHRYEHDNLDDLEAKLKSNERVKKESALYIEADTNLLYGRVVTAMAIAKNAGVTRVMMLTAPSDVLNVDQLDKNIIPAAPSK